MKKLTFKSFLKRKAETMLSVIIVCISFAVVWLIMSNLLIEKDIALKMSYTVQAIRSGADFYVEDNNALIFGICGHSDTNSDSIDGIDIAMQVMEYGSDEVIADSEFAVFLFYREKDGTGHILLGGDRMNELYEKYHNENINLEIIDFYIDGDKFYPGKVKMTKLDGPGLASPMGEPQVLDFTPDNAEDYVYSDTDAMLFFTGTSADSSALKRLRNGEGKDFFGFEGEEPFIIGENYYNIHYIADINFVRSGRIFAVIIIFVGIIIDIFGVYFSAKKEYEKYCIQYETDEYRRNMTAALAHDLKTPLTAIMGYSENLKSNIHTEKKEYYADAVIENVQYMNELITNTLELARLEEYSGEPDRSSVDLMALAEELLSKYRADTDSRGIDISVSGKCVISADKALISRALENLISNAVKYTSDGGRIEVSADDKRLAVSNTCDKKLSGGTADFCRPFGRSDDSRSGRGGGLGLAMVRNIAALHGFTLNVSAADGVFGAEMTF